MKKLSLIAISAVMAVFSYMPLANAGNSAWLPAPGGGSVSLSLIYQNAEEFWAGDNKTTGPLAEDDLTQKTAVVQVKYGLMDSVALDLSAGVSEASKPGAGPKESEDESGVTDVNVGVTVRLVDEAVTQAPSIAVRVGGIKSGSYDTGYINSIGDGADGFEASAIVGKFLSDNFAISGELGYRVRNEDVPNAIFGNVTGSLLFADMFALSVNYTMENSSDGINVGGTPDVNPKFHDTGAMNRKNFPLAEEDVHTLGSTLTFLVGDGASISGSYARVIDGRNTGEYNTFAVSLGYSF